MRAAHLGGLIIVAGLWANLLWPFGRIGRKSPTPDPAHEREAKAEKHPGPRMLGEFALSPNSLSHAVQTEMREHLLECPECASAVLIIRSVGTAT